jgi:hypothetical protein
MTTPGRIIHADDPRKPRGRRHRATTGVDSRHDITPPLPSLAQLLAPPLGGLAVLALLAGLSGCSAISNAIHKQHEESFDSFRAARSGWVGVDIPEWIPHDVTSVHNLATNDEIDAVIMVTTTSGLPASCVDADRIGLPFSSGGAIPRLGSLPDRVSDCGDYEVISVTGGWLGWYNGLKKGDTPKAGL